MSHVTPVIAVLLAAAVLLGLRRPQRPGPAADAPPAGPTCGRAARSAAGVVGRGRGGGCRSHRMGGRGPGSRARPHRCDGRSGAIAVRRMTAVAGPAQEPPADLAGAWEVLAVCLQAGLPVAMAVGAATEPLHGAVGARLRRVSGLLELGADPAGAWLAAEDTPALAAFARAAGRSAATGSALASAARARAPASAPSSSTAHRPARSERAC
ncbi:hypothetical protein BJF78_20570 [Pseudonocardia sp. CNS-139]|nr:hypothetical protein BJF78_20570 [Pseudonocardia sp. CNS-139]